MGRLFHFYGDLRMKKSLFALAALTAIAGAAQAQSSVTLYGALDGALYYGSKVGASSATPLAINAPTTAQTGKDVNVAFADSTIVSSIWGLKGAEDLGGGLKGTFNVEGDLQLNNGGLAGAGLFRRQANVGLDDTKLGALALGLKTNPLIAAHAALMPVSGNSVSTNISGIGGSSYGFGDFFTRNAVTYTSPVLAGFQTQAQVGLGNTVNDNGGGNVYAINGTYKGINNLTVTAAYQNRIASSSASAANYTAFTTATATVASTNPAEGLYSAAKSTGRTTYLAGAQYKLGSFTLGYGYVHNDLKGAIKALTVAGGTTAQSAGTQIHAIHQFGVGYQATPKLLVGATYATGSLDWSLINAQARYSLSPRTTAYAQLGVATNGTYALATAIANQTGTQPAPVVQGFGAAANTTQTAFGAGLIHTF
jgi:GBP family porin